MHGSRLGVGGGDGCDADAANAVLVRRVCGEAPTSVPRVP